MLDTTCRSVVLDCWYFHLYGGLSCIDCNFAWIVLFVMFSCTFLRYHFIIISPWINHDHELEGLKLLYYLHTCMLTCMCCEHCSWLSRCCIIHHQNTLLTHNCILTAYFALLDHPVSPNQIHLIQTISCSTFSSLKVFYLIYFITENVLMDKIMTESVLNNLLFNENVTAKSVIYWLLSTEGICVQQLRYLVSQGVLTDALRHFQYMYFSMLRRYRKTVSQ